MTLSSIDCRTALIVVDLQRGLAALPLAHPFGGVVERAAALADAFRNRRLPVILVNTEGAAPGRREQDAVGGARVPGWTDIVPELRAMPSDHRITKRSPGAFTGTGLEDWLRDRRITQVVVAGVATGTGVEMTARQAYDAGLNVTLAIDAMTDMDPGVHANSVERIFPRIGETGAVAQIIDQLPASRDI